MEILSDKQTFDIKKFNKNLIEEYINIYSNINPNNSNFESINKEEKLLIYVLTFNMNGGIPTEKEMPLLFPKKEKIEHFDIFVINSQECLRSIGASLFFNSKEPWVNALSNFFGDKYDNIVDLTLGALHMVIFIKKEKSIFLSDIRRGEITTGFLNIFANKGAISASMQYYDKHILFICCHLTAGHEKRNERNDELKRIGTSLQNTIDFKSRIKLKKLRKSVIIENSKLNNINILKNMKTHRNINKNRNNSNDKNGSNKKKRRLSMGTIEHKNILNNEIEEADNDNDDEEEDKNQNSEDEEEYEKERLNSTNKNNKEEEIGRNKNDNDNGNSRNKIYNINKSLSSTVNENDKKDKIMEDYDFVIMSGDFNYRLNISHKELNEIMNMKDPEILWDKDQFTEEVKKNQNLKEGVINFMPTYKFKKNSNEYDYNRIPGWTDRILYKSKRYYDIMLCEYSSIKNITLSDHKPVYAVFKINFKDRKFISHNFHKNEQECCIY